MPLSPHPSITVESPARRCSTRLLSKSVQQTLRQLQKEEHELRVANLVQKHRIFYRRQRVCESVTTFSILLVFSGRFMFSIVFFYNLVFLSVFSIYTVLSYGFQYFFTPDYTIVNKSPNQKKRVGEMVTMMCQADDYWEWCRSDTMFVTPSVSLLFFWVCFYFHRIHCLNTI